jgi:hypothetical protein
VARRRVRGLALIVAPAWRTLDPGTHVFLGEAVIRLHQLAARRRSRRCSASSRTTFCTGRSQADTSIAKKYAPAGGTVTRGPSGSRSRRGEGRPLRAFALGYLSHLAADAVAHNYFVPRSWRHVEHVVARPQLLGKPLRDAPRHGARAAARELILIDHSRSDGLLDRVLSPTIFSTPTNRRIFRGMVIVADNESGSGSSS